jgi:zinc transport system substrate-binding protein
MKKFLCILLCVVLLPVFPALAAKKTIVASFYPVYVLAANILDGVEGVHLASMTAPSTGCLHDYQLLTSDMRTLSKAEALLINGAGMEGFLPDLQKQLPDLPVIDCSQGIEFICAEAHDHEAHHDHDHDHGTFNAHIWLDPKNAIVMVTNLADGLIAALPHHANAIAANRDAYIARLAALDAELTAALATIPHKDIITFHEAFPYFAHAYGLNVAAVINRDPDDALSPRQLADLCKTGQALGAPPLFTEPQYEDKAAATISRETGAPLYTLDPIVTGPADAPLTYYEDVMRQNLAVLLQALGE